MPCLVVLLQLCVGVLLWLERLFQLLGSKFKHKAVLLQFLHLQGI